MRTHSTAVNASTVYRTLEVLEELGLVRHAHLSDRAPTYHSVTDHEHFHLVCRNCHRVISVDPDVLTPVIDRLAADHAFTVDIGHLTVFGHCGDCAHVSSPLLSLPGAVAGDGVDAPVAAHYGSLYGEQKTLEAGDGFVDLSHHDVRPGRRARPAAVAARPDHAVLPRPARAHVDPGADPQPAGPRRARLRRRRRRGVVHRRHRAGRARPRSWSSSTGCAS